MTPSKSPAKPCLMLSCSNAWSPLARRVAQALERCGIEIRLDPWDGGGGIPSRQIITQGPEDTAGVLVLLTPSNVARTWIGESWKQQVHDPAMALSLPVLPVRGEDCTIPGFLESQSFADLRYRDYALELERLVESIRDRTGDPRISLPATERIPSQPQLPTAPLVTPVVLETGSSLAHHFSNDALGHLKSEVVPLMRDGLHYELGVPFPGLHVRAVPARRLNAVRMLINDVPEAEFDIPPGRVMVNDDTAAMASRGFDTLPGLNPANGNPTTWIPSEDARTAAAHGLTVWDATGYVVLALSALLRNRAASFVGVEETQSMLASLARAFPHLVAETVPARVSALVLADVLRRLVTEHVSIRNLRRILMAVGTWAPREPDPVYLTEYVRAALQREISHRVARGQRRLFVFLLDPTIEAEIRDAIRHTGTGSYVALEPARLRTIVDAISVPTRELAAQGAQLPAILTTVEIRACVRRLVAPSMPHLAVTSYQELRPTIDIQPVARIGLDGTRLHSGLKVVSPWEEPQGDRIIMPL